MYKVINAVRAGDDVGVNFDVEVNGVVNHYVVSSEAIEDLTKSEKLHGPALLDAFHRVIDRIGEKAQSKHGTPTSGRIALRTADF